MLEATGTAGHLKSQERSDPAWERAKGCLRETSELRRVFRLYSACLANKRAGVRSQNLCVKLSVVITVMLERGGGGGHVGGQGGEWGGDGGSLRISSQPN